jgi:extracellular factor (EF) 3-hydroxypalmitic acid methyl ester biosynthesis protein
VAHRNRVSYLTQKILEETNRCCQAGRPTRILNFGCGPAKEVQDFIAQYAQSDHAQFDLLDFDEKALAYLEPLLNQIKTQHRRRTVLRPRKKSVQQVLRQVGKPVEASGQYDFVYCAGLFDYLNNRTCRSLVAHFYDLLAPGGLLMATNVESQHPIRNIMDHIYEWRLIYRDAKGLAALAPDPLLAEAVSVRTEAAAGNIFLEVRKPSDAL